MSFLTVERISKSYFERTVLDQVSFRLDKGERLALIGHNGAGKTTLMRLITGQEKPDNGLIILPNGIIPGYLSQHVEEICQLDQDSLSNQELETLEEQLRSLEHEMGDMAVRIRQAEDADQPALQPDDLHNQQKRIMERYTAATARFETMGGYDFRHRMQEALDGLGLTGDVLTRPLSTLSGGERMRVALARLLLKSPDLLLLDEPTNHMDAEAMEWLEHYLIRFKGAVLFISHDRMFIDRAATAVAELDHGQLTIRPGNYSHFMEIQAADQLTIGRELKKAERELVHQQDVTQTMLSHRNMSGYHAREKVVAKLSGQLGEIRDRVKRQNGRLNFNFLPGWSEGDPEKILLTAKGLSVSFGRQTLFRQVDLMLRGGEKVCLCGPNGCGKSTLITLLLGRIQSFEGEVRLAAQAVFGHMGQHVTFTDENRTLLEELLARFDLGEGQARTLLARYGFTDIDVFKTVVVLSGGERARLYLCCLLLERPDMLFLDEPTNHLDIRSREILEKALQDYHGAILAVSHDRYFIERCSQSILGFIGDRVERFDRYEDYRTAARKYTTEVIGASNHHPSGPPPRPVLTAKGAAGQTVQVDRLAGGESGTGQAGRTIMAAEDATGPDTRSDSGAKSPNRARERRETALRKEKMRQSERLIAELEQKKLELEAQFTQTSDAAIYRLYADVLSDIDQAYETYVELGEAE